MTPCPDRELMLHALLDGELDAANALEIETHLKTCPGCAAWFRTLQALRERLAEPELSPPAPERLRVRVEAMIARESRPRGARGAAARGWIGRLSAGWTAAGAMAAVAVSLMVVQLAPVPPSLEDQLVASHVRSLQANHLIDVATSDRHVVKPWFNGKIDFAPPVVDLADQGFPLAGGRLDYADNREVAALVYRRRLHAINLFVLPARPRPAAWRPFPSHPATSYSVIHWTRGPLDFWAVSDLDRPELERFHQLFVARS
ncbi:MAG TPA: anti-sigma factor [Caulobacteraceae bacterium]|jgi:anti-sigma factor RsiW